MFISVFKSRKFYAQVICMPKSKIAYASLIRSMEHIRRAAAAAVAPPSKVVWAGKHESMDRLVYCLCTPRALVCPFIGDCGPPLPPSSLSSMYHRVRGGGDEEASPRRCSRDPRRLGEACGRSPSSMACSRLVVDGIRGGVGRGTTSGLGEVEGLPGGGERGFVIAARISMSSFANCSW